MLTQILDVLIGLTVVYLIFSSTASAAAELLEACVRRRGEYLKEGIKELFRSILPRTPEGKPIDDDLSAMLQAFYNSPQISSLFGGSMSPTGKVDGGSLPSYIAAESFSAAVLWLSDPANRHVPNSPDAATSASALVPGTIERNFDRLAKVAIGVVAAGSNVEEQLLRIGSFFEASTERFSGWYRRHVQLVLLGIGGFMAIALNVDTLRIAQVLSEDPVLRASIVEQALKDASSGELAAYEITCEVPEVGANPVAEPANLAQPGSAGAGNKTAAAQAPDVAGSVGACEQRLKDGITRRLDYTAALGLPLGWQDDPVFAASCGVDALVLWIQKVVGLALTALAICMGAPFWFDILNRLSDARTSLKPTQETKDEQPV